MSKAEDFLKECQKHLGEWVCSMHATGSNQPAAIFREVKKMGYEFEEVTPGRWGKAVFCPKCGQRTTHYKLLQHSPTLTKHQRLAINKETREKILDIFERKDAFTGATISSTPEIDHKTPWTRLAEDIDASLLSERGIKEHFQLLTREHNLLKDRACDHCKKTGERPPFIGIPFWYKGNKYYGGTCEGCGWYDGAEWRRSVAEALKRRQKNSGGK